MDILFEERQKFRQWWLWAILVAVSIITVWPMYLIDKDLALPIILPVIGITTTLLILFYVMQLKTMVKKDGIYYQFFPIHFRYKQVKWDDLKSFEVRKYNPLGEYGGWGIRFGMNGKAYNVSGDMGLQLEFKNGKKLLLGTQKAGELSQVLDDIKLDLDLDKHATT